MLTQQVVRDGSVAQWHRRQQRRQPPQRQYRRDQFIGAAGARVQQPGLPVKGI